MRIQKCSRSMVLRWRQVPLACSTMINHGGGAGRHKTLGSEWIVVWSPKRFPKTIITVDSLFSTWVHSHRSFLKWSWGFVPTKMPSEANRRSCENISTPHAAMSYLLLRQLNYRSMNAQSNERPKMLVHIPQFHALKIENISNRCINLRNSVSITYSKIETNNLSG